MIFGDWRNCKTKYTYADKEFLNEQFTKFGKYHIKLLLRTIYQLNIDELLPEILISIKNVFNSSINIDEFKKVLKDEEFIINRIIIKAFFQYSDEIKQDQELTNAYEYILETLISHNYEKAAVLLDEFRIN